MKESMKSVCTEESFGLSQDKPNGKKQKTFLKNLKKVLDKPDKTCYNKAIK